MGLFRKAKYEKGGVVRGTIQATTGVSQYTAGKTKEAISGGSTSMTTGLKRKGVSNMFDGTKKILGMRVKKK
jgi:hypothetical protein